MLQFTADIGHDFRTPAGVQFFIHAPQRHADNITMMKLAAEVIAKLQPQLMNQIDVFGPKPRRMRTEVHEYRRTIG